MKDVFQKELQFSNPEFIRHFKTAIARGSTFKESLLAMFHFFAGSMPLDFTSVISITLSDGPEEFQSIALNSH